MADYRIYFMDRANHIVGVVEFVCAGDGEAIARTLEHADGRAMELWNRSRLVRRFDGDAEPAPPASTPPPGASAQP